MTQHDTRFGHAAIVGRPNVGKSTLMNYMVQTKLAITSRRPNTTRDRLVGVLTRGACQVGFVDTPGIERRRRRDARAMERYMHKQAVGALEHVDVVLMVIDARGWHEADTQVCALLKRSEIANCICVINKIELLAAKEILLPLMEAAHSHFGFKAIVPVSALRNDGLQALLLEVEQALPLGEHAYGMDAITDQSERYLVAEVIREKIMRRLGDEIPYRTAVVVESFVREQARVSISAVVQVERAGQKAIMVGKGGARIKSIGIDARRSMEQLLGEPVVLKLLVKVRPGWSAAREEIAAVGYR